MSTRTRVNRLEDCAARQTARITNLEDQRCNSNGRLHARLSVLEGLHPEVSGDSIDGWYQRAYDRQQTVIADLKAEIAYQIKSGDCWRHETDQTVVNLRAELKRMTAEIERLGNELFAAHMDKPQQPWYQQALAAERTNRELEAEVKGLAADNTGLKTEADVQRRACRAAEGKLAKIHAAAKSNRSCNHHLNCGCLTCRVYRMSAPP